MVVDYWMIRRRELDVPDLYRVDGRYAGVNWTAIGALVVGRGAQRAGIPAKRAGARRRTRWLMPSTRHAWFTGFFVAGVLYRLGMRRSGFGQVAPC